MMFRSDRLKIAVPTNMIGNMQSAEKTTAQVGGAAVPNRAERNPSMTLTIGFNQ